MSSPQVRTNGRCQATTKAGKPCPAHATASGLCYWHENPERAAEMGRKGGLKNRHVTADTNVEMMPLNSAADVRMMLAKLAHDVRTLRVEPRVAASISQIAGTLLKAIEVADIEQRIAKLEGKTNGPEETN